MKLLSLLLLAVPLSFPCAALARKPDASHCYAAHFVRSGGSEMRFTVIVYTNADREHPATVERLTFRDADGNILSDTGPRAGVPHPLSLGPVPPRDITVIPPGGTYATSTSDLWGFNPIPGYETRGADLISVRVEISKRGDRELVGVSAREIARDRVLTPTGPTVGAERAANQIKCADVD